MRAALLRSLAYNRRMQPFRRVNSGSRLRPLAGLFLLGLLAGLLCASSYSTAATSAADTASPHDYICAGCTEILGDQIISPCTCSNPDFEPLAWGSALAIGGDKLALPGTLPVIAWAGSAGQGRVLFWSGHEAFWTGQHDGKLDSNSFRLQAFEWLLHGKNRIAFGSGHGEIFGVEGWSPALRIPFDAAGVSAVDLPGELNAGSLSSCDLLCLMQPGAMSDSEVAAVQDWVRGGGSLLMAAQGWSSSDIEQHSMNRIGAAFGLHMSSGIFSDTGAPNGKEGEPSFAVRPLSEYTPAKVVILRTSECDVNSVRELAAQQPHDIYIVEGEHMGIELLSNDWPRLNDPAAMIACLDRMYETQVGMLGGKNRPFHGDKVWVIPQHAPDAGWYMHSGNPIVIQEGASGDLVESFNKYGNPGWGLAHESGHNMHLDACAFLFGADVVEPCANIFTVDTFRRLGWDQAQNGHAGYEQEGYAYSAQAEPHYQQVKDSAWIFLGLLDKIWAAYGWDGMEKFLAQAADDAAHGMTAPDDAFRTAYLVEGLSAAYGRDFSPVFAHWDFPLTEETKAKTAQYPAAEIVY